MRGRHMDVSPLVPWLHPHRGLLVYRNPVHAHEGGIEERIHDYVMRSRQVIPRRHTYRGLHPHSTPWNRSSGRGVVDGTDIRTT